MSDAGLVRRDRQLVRGVCLAVTAEGMRVSGHPAESAPKHPLSPSIVSHKCELSWAAAWLEALGHDWVSEREMRSDGRGGGPWILPIGENTHIPDLGLELPDGGNAAIEVELSQKSASRLQAIAAAYAAKLGDGRLDQVTYIYAHDAIAKAVLRAFTSVGARDSLALIGVEEMHRRARATRVKSTVSTVRQGPFVDFRAPELRAGHPEVGAGSASTRS